jgi:hypothetical protein
MHDFGKKQKFAMEKTRPLIVSHSLEELSGSLIKVVKSTSKTPAINKQI